LGEGTFEAKGIPGSIDISNMQDAIKMLNPSDDIVILCSNPLCPSSIIRHQFLEHNGYKKLRRYAGGLQDWEEAGFPL
jgi:rhodanese-related sulfurtransferase